MPKTYKYLNPGPNRAPEDVLFGDTEPLGPEEVIIRDELHNKYLKFENWNSFWKWQNEKPSIERCYNEVILGCRPQRLKFDIDAPEELIETYKQSTNSPAQCFEDILNTSADIPPLSACIEKHSSIINPVSADTNQCNNDSMEKYLETLGIVNPVNPVRADTNQRNNDSMEKYLETLGIVNQVSADNTQRNNDSMEKYIESLGIVDTNNTLWKSILTEPIKKYTKKYVVPDTHPIKTIINTIIETILDVLYITYKTADCIRTTRKDITVYSSSGKENGKWKHSYHIIVTPYVVANNEEAKYITAKVIESLKSEIRPFIDPQVNKSIQGFRLEGSRKSNSERTKLPCKEFGTASTAQEDSGISAPDGERRVLARLCTKENISTKNIIIPTNPDANLTPTIGHADLKVILAATKEIVKQAHEFRQVLGRNITFQRTHATYCTICNRIHDNDNTLILSVIPEADTISASTGPAKHRIIERCRRNTSQSKDTKIIVMLEVTYNTINAKLPRKGLTGTKEAEEDTSTPAGAAASLQNITSMQDIINKRLTDIDTKTVTPHESNKFEILHPASQHIYSEPYMRKYEKVPTLVVKAPMKTGKTRELRKYIDQEFPPTPAESGRGPVIRIITFRQAFARSLQENFKDFDMYSDQEGTLDHHRYPRLIVQAESLHRLPMPLAPEPIDLLVLDEVESILAQFGSGLHRNLSATFAMFNWLMSTARHVVVMDANVGDRTYNTLAKMRPKYPAFFHWNNYARAAEDVFHFTASKTKWFSELLTQVREGRRIVLPTSSIVQGETFESVLRDMCPDKIIRMYSSKTSQDEKNTHFADVHTKWSELDVLIYTPTVSAGISYELKHYDTLFGYFADTSCDVETCRQMLARVRNISSHDHYICLSGRQKYYPSSVEDIRRVLNTKRSALSCGDTPDLMFEYKENGEVVYHESPYFHLWLENTRMNALSENNFITRFIDQVSDSGAIMHEMQSGQSPAALKETGAILSARRDKNRNEYSVAVSTADVISAEVAAEIRERYSSSKQCVVSTSEQLSFTKFQLCSLYSQPSDRITPQFVLLYDSLGASRIYKNRLRVMSCSTMSSAIITIRTHELDAYTNISHSRYNDRAATSDLNFRYVSYSHSIAFWLLQLCGFQCITDNSCVHSNRVLYSIRDSVDVIIKSLPILSQEFKLSLPSVKSLLHELDDSKFLKRIVKFVNSVIGIMYGVAIRSLATKTNLYRLRNTTTGAIFTDVIADAHIRVYVPSRLLYVSVNVVGPFIDSQFYDYSNQYDDWYSEDDLCVVDDLYYDYDSSYPEDDLCPDGDLYTKKVTSLYVEGTDDTQYIIDDDVIDAIDEMGGVIDDAELFLQPHNGHINYGSL
jgi:hypothetical protein